MKSTLVLLCAFSWVTAAELQKSKVSQAYGRSLEVKGNTPLEQIAPKLIETIRKAGYENYPGHGPSAKP